MITRRLFAATAGALVALPLIASTPVLAQSGEPLKIGLLAPTRTLLGGQAVEAAQIAAAMINEAGGAAGRKIELLVYDDANSPVESVSGVQRLVDQDGVKIVVGPYGSTQALAVLPVAQAEGLLFMAAAPKHPDVTKSGYDKVFRFNSTVAMDGEVLGAYMRSLDPKGIAYIGDNNETGRAYLKGLRSFFPDDKDNRVVFEQFYDSTSSDFSGIVTDAKASGADTLYLAGINVEQYGNILRVAKELGFQPANLVLAPGILNARAVELAAGGAEGAVTTDIYVPSVDTELNKKFVAAYREKKGVDPEKLEMLWFEAVWTLGQAINRVGSADDVQKLADTIHAEAFESPRGELRFDEAGQALSKPFIVGVTDGVVVRR